MASLSRLEEVVHVTAPSTLEDLNASSLLPSHLLRRATRQAELKGYRLDHVIETDRTCSDLERLFLAIVHSYTDLELEEEPGRVAGDVARALQEASALLS